MEAAVILLALSSVPLTAIIGHYLVKARTIGKSQELSALDARVQRLVEDNAVLRHRVETLEAIVVDDTDFDTRRRFHAEGLVLPRSRRDEEVAAVEAALAARRP